MYIIFKYLILRNKFFDFKKQIFKYFCFRFDINMKII
jgi:hypothetical protein